MNIEDILKIQNDISHKQAAIENLLLLIRSKHVTLQEKTALKKAVNVFEKSVIHLETALNNNL